MGIKKKIEKWKKAPVEDCIKLQHIYNTSTLSYGFNLVLGLNCMSFISLHVTSAVLHIEQIKQWKSIPIKVINKTAWSNKVNKRTMNREQWRNFAYYF